MYYLSNICFMCLKDNKNLQNAFLNNVNDYTFEQIKYVFPEITLEPEFPPCVCSTCHTELHSFYTFKKLCLENYCRLKNFTKLLQGSADNTKDQLFSTLQIEINKIKEKKQLNAGLSTKTTEELHINFTTEEVNIGNKEDITFETNGEQNQHQHILSDNKKQNNSEDDCFLHLITNTNKMEQSDNCFDAHTNHKYENRDEKSVCNNNTNVEILVCTPDLNQNINEESHMNNEIKGFECQICSKKFTTETCLSVHKKIHEGIQDIQCFICDKKFSQKGNLKSHMKTHLGKKSFECSQCSKMFTTTSCLNKHMKIHYGIKNFECYICNKKFTRKDQLKVHVKIHDGVKDYHCFICDKKFSHRSNLNAHVKIHAGLKDFECSKCNKKFLRQSDLKRHLKIHR